MKETIYLKDYKPSPFLIKSVELNVTLHPTETIVKSKLHIKSNHLSAEKNVPLVLDGEKLKLMQVKLNNRVIKSYTLTDKALTIPGVKTNDSLEITTKINPDANKALEGLYLSNNVFCTQCEPEGFRHITYYLDRPDVMASFIVRIEGDKTQHPVLLSNGNLTEKGDLPGNKHFAVYVDPFKKPCYLFALVAGKLDRLVDEFVTASGKKVKLCIYVEAGNRQKARHAMGSVKKSMRWDEVHYGLEYDLEIFNIVAVSDFVMGAMENKSLNIFNDKYILADSKTATDFDYENIDRVVGHEYFHNWTGDRVTCREWFDLCLKEGLTVYREQSFMESETDPVTARIDQVITLTDRQFGEDAGPLSHPVRPEAYQQINNFYTATVYEKGSEIFRMLANLVGKQGFRKATDLYFKRFDGQAVTIEDFVGVVEESNKIKLDSFKQWYSQSGTPIVKVKSHYDNQTLTLTLTQESKSTLDQTEKKNLHIPIAIGLLDQLGVEILKTQIISLDDKETVVTFNDVPSKPILSLLRNFTSPVKLQYDYSLEELNILALHDTDHFNRWSAMQRLHNHALVELTRGNTAHLSNYLDVIAQLLKKTDMSLRTLARCLTLPSDTVMLDQFVQVDLDAVLTAKKQLIRAIATHNKSQLQALYDQHHDAGEYVYENKAVNKRIIKNVCLYYLAQTDDTAILSLIKQQCQSVNNMTDEVGLLRAVNDVECSERTEIFEAFHDKWQHEHLVVNKWLAMEAASNLVSTFDRVKALEHHAAFNIKNPNKVYALLLQFSVNNLQGFHQKSGAAYEFMADKVIEIDKFNPQVASRLVHCFANWKRFDAHRQSLIQAALKRIASQPAISSNVAELVNKTLMA